MTKIAIFAFGMLAACMPTDPPVSAPNAPQSAAFEKRAIATRADFDAVILGNGIYTAGTKPVYVVNPNGRLDATNPRFAGSWKFENGQFCEKSDSDAHDAWQCAHITQVTATRLTLDYTTGWLSAQPFQIRGIGPAAP